MEPGTYSLLQRAFFNIEESGGRVFNTLWKLPWWWYEKYALYGFDLPTRRPSTTIDFAGLTSWQGTIESQYLSCGRPAMECLFLCWVLKQYMDPRALDLLCIFWILERYRDDERWESRETFKLRQHFLAYSTCLDAALARDLRISEFLLSTSPRSHRTYMSTPQEGAIAWAHAFFFQPTRKSKKFSICDPWRADIWGQIAKTQCARTWLWNFTFISVWSLHFPGAVPRTFDNIERRTGSLFVLNVKLP